MTKIKREALERELAILRELNGSAKPTTKSPKSKSPKGSARILRIHEDVAKTAKCADGSGYEYSVIEFMAESKDEMTDVQLECKSALQGVTWGKNSNGRFRFNNRNFTGNYGWSGRTDKIPAIVTKNNK
jgi:hypothetical protein